MLIECNFANKPIVITCVIDLMVESPCPILAKTTNVVNAILDGTYGVLLKAQTLKGLYAIEPSQLFTGLDVTFSFVSCLQIISCWQAHFSFR